MRDFAERLIAYETRANKSSGINAPAAFPVCEKLRPHLVTLMGNTGVRTLFSRALTVTREEVDSLGAVRVKADGSFEEIDELEAHADPEAFAKGSVILIAQLLGLLAAFIGENLMLQIVCGVWPKLALNDLNLLERDKQ
jgi:hypothetical protein